MMVGVGILVAEIWWPPGSWRMMNMESGSMKGKKFDARQLVALICSIYKI